MQFVKHLFQNGCIYPDLGVIKPCPRFFLGQDLTECPAFLQKKHTCRCPQFGFGAATVRVEGAADMTDWVWEV